MAKSKEKFDAVEIKTLSFTEGLNSHVETHKISVLQNELESDGWTLIEESTQNLLKKLKSIGIPLGEYVSEKLFRGVLTGLNEAFVIDEETRDRLIKEDPKSEEVIKPFLAGRDIKRYQPPLTNKYLVLFKSGDTKSRYGDLPEVEAWEKLSNEYPAICEWLSQFEVKAKKRYDQGQYWWELRACNYYEEFENRKIMLPDISLRCEALMDEDGQNYCVNTAYIIPDLSYSDLAILNSTLIHFFYSNLTQTIRGGYHRFIRQYLKQIPMIKTDILDDTVSEILKRKQDDPNADISVLDRKLDEIVYQLYNLTEEEINIIEQAS